MKDSRDAVKNDKASKSSAVSSLPLILDVDDFKGDFSFDALFGNLVNELLPSFQDEETYSSEGHGSGAGGNDALSNGHLRGDAAKSAAPLFPEVDKLLGLFKDSYKELVDLRKQVDGRLNNLKKEVSVQDSKHRKTLAELEKGVDGLFDSFARLDSRISSVGQTAAKIGDHLQSTDAQRETASQTIELIKYLMEFNSSPGDLKSLGVIGFLILFSGVCPCVELENRLLARFDAASQRRELSSMAECAKILSQVLGYGWAALLRKYVVEPAHMWWPASLIQVSLFRALHEKEERHMSRGKFFLIALICSFTWYMVPGYLFSTLTNISWVCWAFSKSVTAQQLGSGMQGLGIGALTLDWAAVASFLFSPLISPFYAIVNVFAGYVLIVYVAIPIAYWGFDLYGASRFLIFSSQLSTSHGEQYNISAIVNDKFELDIAKYEEQGLIHLSMFFAITYGFGFATVAATLTHVAFFHGREIYERFRASYKGKEDIHTKLMRRYKDIPSWWFYLLLAVTLAVSLQLCTILIDQIQMPWWGLLLASAIAFTFTLPISIITTTTNQMKEGKLPVRYLGVPLISSRLSSADCGVLLERITGRIDSWLFKNLSYTDTRAKHNNGVHDGSHISRKTNSQCKLQSLWLYEHVSSCLLP